MRSATHHEKAAYKKSDADKATREPDFRQDAEHFVANDAVMVPTVVLHISGIPL